MLPTTYYHLHYCSVWVSNNGGSTSLLLSAAMYPDSGGADEKGMIMTSDWRPTMKGDHLLRGTIDDVGGIHNKL